MGEPTAAMKELAHRLVAFEQANSTGSNAGSNAATRVVEKLRIIVTRFSGSDSSEALMRRAVALSRIEDPSLEGRPIMKGGSIALIEGITNETSLTLTVHLLDLMRTFMGQALTVSLLSDTWPLDTLIDS